MRSPFVAGAFSGAAAGLLAATVAFFLLEPTLRAAIALEGGDGDGVVSRSIQERLGLPLGFVVTGVAFGLVLAAVDRGTRARANPWRRALVLSSALFAALVALPQLRYPPNPPGVGDPESVASRTGAYLLAVLMGVLVVTLVALALRHLSDADQLDPARQVLVVAVSLTVVGLCWSLLPDSGDPVELPAGLLWDFRIRSLGVSALLWATLGAAYGAFGLRQAARHPVGA